LQDSPKFTQIVIFGLKNIASGNPGPKNKKVDFSQSRGEKLGKSENALVMEKYNL
jgi:hypothetical protein